MPERTPCLLNLKSTSWIKYERVNYLCTSSSASYLPCSQCLFALNRWSKVNRPDKINPVELLYLHYLHRCETFKKKAAQVLNVKAWWQPTLFVWQRRKLHTDFSLVILQTWVMVKRGADRIILFLNQRNQITALLCIIQKMLLIQLNMSVLAGKENPAC